MKLVRGGPFVTARIVHSQGLWYAVVDGAPYAPAADPAAAPRVFTIWHSGDPISEADYLRRLRIKREQIAADPNHPAAHPTKRIDLTALPPLF